MAYAEWKISCQTMFSIATYPMYQEHLDFMSRCEKKRDHGWVTNYMMLEGMAHLRFYQPHHISRKQRSFPRSLSSTPREKKSNTSNDKTKVFTWWEADATILHYSKANQMLVG